MEIPVNMLILYTEFIKRLPQVEIVVYTTKTHREIKRAIRKIYETRYDTTVFCHSKGIFRGKRVKKLTVLKRIRSLKQLEEILRILKNELEPLWLEWGFNP